MTVVTVGSLTFHFDPGWQVEKYDDWTFYRSAFQKIRAGVKAVDIVALSPDESLYLIEVKDYREHPRTKPSEIHDEVSRKVLDTLAGLLPGTLNATLRNEKDFCQRALSCRAVKIILHLEQPLKSSKIFPRAIDPASVTTRLRQALKAIDRYPKVCRSGETMPWTVERLGSV